MKSFGAGAAAAILTAWVLETIPADVQATEAPSGLTRATEIGADQSRVQPVRITQQRVVRALPMEKADSSLVLGLVELDLPFKWKQSR